MQDESDHIWLNSLRGVLAAWRGEDDIARSLADETQTGAGLSSEWGSALLLLAEVAMAEGEPMRVRRVLEEVWTKPDLANKHEDVARMLIVGARAEADIVARARALHDDDQLATSAETLDQMRTAAGLINFTSPLGDACRAHFDAELSRWAGTSDAGPWLAALEAWARIGFPHEQSWARLRLAESYLERGDLPAATETLREALHAAEGLPEPLLIRECNALARRARLDLEPEPAPTIDKPGTGDGADLLHLTDREREVLALLTEGYGNAQIAKRLFMSPKTASVHVSRILTKLGASNRTQAATIAHRLQLNSPD
jgi:DNA-binding CsgD family transcriptional regulator